MITEILTEDDYNKALDRLDYLFDAILDSPEGQELEKLYLLIEEWENKNYPI